LDVRIAAAKDGSLLATRTRKVDSHLAVVAGAVILAHEDVEKRTETFLEMLGKGLLPPKELLVTSKAVDLIYEGVKYSLQCCQAGPRLFTVSSAAGGGGGREGGFGGGDALVEAQCRPLADGGYLLVIAGKSQQVVYANQEASGLRLSVNGHTCVFTKEYDPACLDTDVAGKLARRVVADGARVKQGEAYCEVEVMKMYMPLCVRESGVVRWHLSEGAALKPGDRLATLELDDPTAVTMAEVFQGVLSPAITVEVAVDASQASQSAAAAAAEEAAAEAAEADGDDSADVTDDKPNVALRTAVGMLSVVLSGYAVPEEQYLRSIATMRTSLADELLPYHELKEALSVLSGRLDGGVAKQLQARLGGGGEGAALADEYKSACAGGGGGARFPAEQALSILNAYWKGIPDERERAAFWTTVSDLAKVVVQHVQGPAGRASAALLNLIQEYLNVERSFAGGDVEDSLKAMRKTHEGEEAGKVYDAFRSHAAIARKNRLLLTLLDDIRRANAEAKAFSSERKEGLLPTTREGEEGQEEDVGASVKGLADGGVSGWSTDTEAFLPVLAELSSLSDVSYAPVAARSRQLLIEYNSPSAQERRAVFCAAVTEVAEASTAGDAESRQAVMDDFVGRGVPVRDLLLPLISATEEATGRAALELYARRIYRTHVVDNFSWMGKTEGAHCTPQGNACRGVLHRGLFSFQSKSTGALPSSAGYNGGSFVDLQLLAAGAGADS
ncbi:unnamed protein product, partial [Laminaria digitata]